MMDSVTPLEYFLFQLTPTRTRCDLVIFAGKSHEKLAHGLLEPFIAHLKSLKDQISKGGYSVILRPKSGPFSPWFTKGTLQRFVRFVSTPEVLERFVTIEREIEQLEDSIKSYEASNADGIKTEGDGTTFGGNSKNSPTSFKVKEVLSRSNDPVPEETSKARLQRVVETRKAVLQKEQAMVYARALAAGFEMDNLADLLLFSDAFGASRLREACINFKDLCKKKNEDRMWVDEIAAMQAMVQPDLSYMGTSEIILTEDNDTSLGSQDASQECASTLLKDSKAQMPNPWVNQFAPYLQNYQGPVYQQMPPYYPGMQQVAPPYYPPNMQWTPNGDRDLHEHRDYKKSSRKKDKGRENDQEKSTESSGSSSENETSDSSTEKSRGKKHGKKSSRKVIIRNINYITSKRDGERNSSFESDSSDGDDYLDGTFKKQHKSSSHRRVKREGLQHDEDDEGASVMKEGKKGNDNWGAFQDLLLKEEPVPSPKPSIYVEQNQRPGVTDAFLVTDKATGGDGNVVKLSVENFDPSENFHPSVKRGTTEEFLFAQRNGEPGCTHVELSDDVVRSSVKRSQASDDWFINKLSNEAAGDNHLMFVDGDYRTSMGSQVEKKTKDAIIDDSLMIQGRLSDDSESQRMTIASFASDFVKVSIAENVASEVPLKKSESHGFYEPDELYMVLDRDSSREPLPSWTPEMDYENNVPVKDTGTSLSDADTNANSNTTSKDKTPKKEKNGASATKALGKDTRSRSLSGPLRKGKPDPTPSRRSTFGSKTTDPKSLPEKKQEEERRKRMEGLLIQRQKRIAERSAATRKDQSSAEETKKSKTVFRSSTIERLAAAKTVPKDATPVKKAVAAKR